MEGIKIYIVIVTYNGIQWIEQCLNSIPKEYSIVIVDNHSSDETIAFIKQNFPRIHLIEQNENLGFGKANNIGISYALHQEADFVFLLNQDAYLEQDTISKLIQAHKKYSDYGVLSPIHLNGKGTKLDHNFSVYIQQNKELQYDSLKGTVQNKPYNVPFINAAGWFIPAKIFEIIGGFDPLFYHYGEDNNFCQRVLFHDFKVGVVPNTYIKHDREYREIKKEQTFKERLALKERIYKSKWADINLEFSDAVNQIKRMLIKTLFKSLFLLRAIKVKEIFFEYKMIKKILPCIYISRTTNKKVGKHYLK